MTGSLLVRGGTAVAPGGAVRADVLVLEGRIAAIGAVDAPGGVEEVDAGGCLVLPGGVDVHAHVFGRVPEDTRSALLGGTTTVLSFMPEAEGEPAAETVRRVVADEVPGSHVDLGVHGVLWEPEAYRPGDLAALAAAGAPSVKLWLAYRELGIMIEDDVALAVMREAAAEGVLVQAHCENGRLVDALRAEHVADGRTALRHHGEARPPALEAEAVHRFLAIAALAGAEAYVVHVSCREALAAIAAARSGADVTGEGCLHHLLLDAGAYGGPDAARYLVTPPLRGADDRAALWSALAGGDLAVLASDHGHVTLAEKRAGGDDFTRAEYGVPGLEVRLAAAFTYGVEAGRLTVERLVEVCCTAPARRFGLGGRKGVLAPGADGDVVVWDPAVRWEVGRATLHDGLDYSPYDGLVLAGRPRGVVCGGEVAAWEGRLVEREAGARYLARGPAAVAA